jgi:hypothetical protein
MSIRTHAVGEFVEAQLQDRIATGAAKVLGLSVTDDMAISDLVEVKAGHFRCFVLCNSGCYRVHGRQVPITNLWVCVYNHNKGTATEKVGDTLVKSGWLEA